MAIATLSPYFGIGYALEGAKKESAALKKIDSGITIVPKETFENSVKKELWVSTASKKILAFFLDPNKPSWINSLAGEARAIFSVVKNFFHVLKRASKIFSSTQFTHYFSLPFDTYSFAMRFYSLAVDKGIQPKIDALLGMIGDVSSLGDGITSIIMAFTELGIFAGSTMAWANPINIASNLLGAIFFAINGRSLYYSIKAQKALNEKLKGEKADYRAAWAVIQNHRYALGSHCGVNMQILDAKIAQVFKTHRWSKESQAVKDEKFEAQMKQVYAALQKRIKQKQASLGLGFAFTTIATLGTLLFAFSPLCAPLAIAGASLFIVMHLINMGKLSNDIYANSLFKRKMRQINVAAA